MSRCGAVLDGKFNEIFSHFFSEFPSEELSTEVAFLSIKCHIFNHITFSRLEWNGIARITLQCNVRCGARFSYRPHWSTAHEYSYIFHVSRKILFILINIYLRSRLRQPKTYIVFCTGVLAATVTHVIYTYREEVEVRSGRVSSIRRGNVTNLSCNLQMSKV